MGVGAHAQRHGGAAAGGASASRVAAISSIRPAFDQLLRQMVVTEAGETVKLACARVHAGDVSGGADAFKDLLAQGPLGFGQGGNQRADALC